MKRNAKKCPNCGVFIVRISGCDTMFCTNCGVGFHWKTLQIYTKGIVYNPHFFEYRRLHGNPQSDTEEDQCNRWPQPDQLKIVMDKCNADFKLISGTFDGKRVVVDYLFWENYLLSLHGKEEYDLQYWIRENDVQARLRRLRFLYMMNLITMEEWKRRLLSLDKLQARNTEFVQILEMNI